MSDNNATAAIRPNSTKRQWRVGTFSMGTILIIFGLVLLLAQFKNFSGLKLISTWWPAVMIILGLEILAAIYFSGEEKPVIKYDMLSVFMVLLIGGVTLGMYALTSVGIIPALVESFSSRTFSVDVPEQRIPLSEGIKHVVVNASGFTSVVEINVREADSNEVVAFAQASVSANSQAAAESMVPDGLVGSHTVGDTLFLDVKSVSSANQFQQVPHVEQTIILPRGRSVQVEADTAAPLKVKLNSLENNWTVKSPGTVEVTVAKDANIKVEAFARRLAGESMWIPINPDDPGVKNPDGSVTFGETAEGEITGAKGKASVTFGKGGHKLEINADEVYVNDILS